MRYPYYYLLGLCLLLSSLAKLSAQRQYDVFWIGFKNKSATPYSLFAPQKYLSPRTLDRRQRLQIPIDSTDLPVSPQYTAALQAEGLKIHGTSRWFNGAVVIGTAEQIETLSKKLDFISESYPIGFSRTANKAQGIGRRDVSGNFRRSGDYYGAGSNQIKMLNGHTLHQIGFRGEGVHVAVFDGGFVNLRETPVFYHLYERNLVLGTHDFVEGDDFVYESDDHGRDVASCMASNIPNLFVGTSPDASYYFFKTEDGDGELLAEEFYWLLAAERADSLGVDIINSSLGYAQFDDKRMNHAYVELDGKTVPISRAASLAADKGIIVVTSAGNEGNEKWKHITAPGDAPNILTVGAVDRDGFYAGLSSVGFSNRDYVKPNVAARGLQSVVATRESYDTRYNSGTSFSSPIMAGMVACLLQAYPERPPLEIFAAIQAAGDQALRPDYKKGYGIPDFFEAYKLLGNSVLEINAQNENNYLLQPLDCQKRFDIVVNQAQGINYLDIELFNAVGDTLQKERIEIERNRPVYTSLKSWPALPEGVYYLYIRLGKITKRAKLVKYLD